MFTKLPKIIIGINPQKLVLIIAIFFFLLNLIYIKLDHSLPIIGDDARYLQGTFELYEPLKNGYLSGFWNTWQSMFIHPERFPRTPLFALVSVPAFFVFGVNQDSAIVTNLIIIVINSLLIFKLSRSLIKSKYAGILAATMYNLLPGIFGFGRLYMSEGLQTTFVLLLTLWFEKNSQKFKPKHFVAIGVIAALAVLLRFIIPIYLLIPAALFVYRQLQLKKKTQYYFVSLVSFLIGFLPIALTWYGKNFATYYEFAKYTSSGELIKYYSLGPVFSPVTVARFWYVIGTWEFGLPFIILSVFTLSLTVIKGLEQRARFAIKSINRNKLFYLFLIPIPGLISITLSEGKTARYFLPVMPFWIMLIAVFTVRIYAEGNRFAKIVVSGLLFFCTLPIVLSVTGPRQLPLVGDNPAVRKYDTSYITHERYSFFLDTWKKHFLGQEQLLVYNTAEQSRFNDAQIIWYATENKVYLRNTDEFSRYSDLEEGKAEVNEADVVIVETQPEANELSKNKFAELNRYVFTRDNLVEIDRKRMQDGSVMYILANLKTYAKDLR